MAYFCLLLLFAISVVYHARTAVAVLNVLLDSSGHVREPFDIDGAEMALTHVHEEARARGIKAGDRLIGMGGRPLRGYTDFYSVLRQARPGQPAFPNGPQASDWLSFAIEDLAIPTLCFELGFWVSVVRIRDKLAWLLLILLLSFA